MSPRRSSRSPLIAGGTFAAIALLVVVTSGNVLSALVLGALAAAVAWALTKRRESADSLAGSTTPAVTTPRPGTPRTLELGDVVNLDDRMWLVEGTLRFDEGGFVWHEHLLVDGPDRFWLSVEDDEGELELVRWQKLRGLELDPSARSVHHDGVDYAFDERGTASFTSAGTTGAPASGRADYADFQAGDRRLGFERFGGEAAGWEVAVGEVISEHVLDIYPGGAGSAGAPLR